MESCIKDETHRIRGAYLKTGFESNTLGLDIESHWGEDLEVLPPERIEGEIVTPLLVITPAVYTFSIDLKVLYMYSHRHSTEEVRVFRGGKSHLYYTARGYALFPETLDRYIRYIYKTQATSILLNLDLLKGDKVYVRSSNVVDSADSSLFYKKIK